MADSDDEYDRKQRDKFRGERTMSDRFGAERRLGGSSREDWSDRNPFRSGAGGGGGGGGGGANSIGSGGRGRADYRDFRGSRDRYSPPSRDTPPAKRMRTDWNDDYRSARYPAARMGYDPYMMHAAWGEHYTQYGGGGHGSHALPRDAGPNNSSGDSSMQPAMLTLKQFLETQDDNISDEEVLTKYNEYKLNFKRQQLNDFFITHKEEEWFKQKYHPVISAQRKEEQIGLLKRRTEVFTELLTNGYVNQVRVDISHTDALIRLMDTTVIKLEGGTDEDLKVLDEKPEEPPILVEPKIKKTDNDEVVVASLKRKREEEEEANVAPVTVSPARVNRGAAAADSGSENWGVDEEESSKQHLTAADAAAKSPVVARTSRSARRLSRQSRDDHSSSSNNSEPSVKDVKTQSQAQNRRKKNYKRRNSATASASTSSSSDSETDSKTSSSSSENENENENEQSRRRRVKKKYELGQQKSDDDDADELKSKVQQELVNKKVKSVDEDSENHSSGEEPTNEKKIDDSPVKSADGNNAINEAAAADSTKLEKSCSKAVANGENNQPTETEPEAEPEPELEMETIDLDLIKPKLKALHQTSSIFLRNLSPAITKNEILQLCEGYNGLLRVAIADPLPERRWYRRGWITFERDVNVKDICWNLNSKRVRDCEIGAIVNRDLSRRVRQVVGLTGHKTVVRTDIRHCAKIIMNLDETNNLWVGLKQETERQSTNGVENSNNNNSNYGLKSNNPVLQNIRDYLVEEASAEEEELLGISGENKEPESDNIFERDDELIGVLDRLILYMRIVHSVDFYNHCEYPYEDEMPNRCGIIHARGPTPTKLSSNEVSDYNKSFEAKLKQFLTKPTLLTDDEIKDLGAKDPEEEVKKFVDANTTKVAEGKWLCPLSEKKFKGPEFVHKHIFNKHMTKVEEVKQEVHYFNNYLRDPKRPQLQEHVSGGRRTGPNDLAAPGAGFRGSMYPPAYLPPAYALPPMAMSGRVGGGARGFGGGRGREPTLHPPQEHQRRIVAYHDLDSPANFDMFE